MSKTDEGKSSPEMKAIEGILCVKNFKTIIKLTESWSTFYYHHHPAILNNISDKIVIRQKESFIELDFKQLLRLLLSLK